LKLSSCCKYRVYYTYITESFLQQPSLHAISTLISLYCGFWQIQKWSLLPKHGSRNKPYALCPTAKRRIPLSPLKSREAYTILASLSPCFSWWLWNGWWLIFPIRSIISPTWAYQGCPPSNLQCSVFTGMVASVFLGWIIGNNIPFVIMNATTAHSHASQDPCVHF
jgi:hypothetical protein